MSFNPGDGGGISNASDVALSNPLDNQILAYNASVDKWNNVHVHKAAFGLENVDNTSDADKPISDATQSALDAKADIATSHIILTPSGDTATDTTAMDTAIDQARSSGNTIHMKAGTYQRNTPWDCRGDGLKITTDGPRSVIVVQQTPNTPILLLGRQFQQIGGMALTYSAAQDSSATNANAIELYKAYMGSYGPFHISKPARGLHIPQVDYNLHASDTDGNYGAFSCRFNDIWIEEYSLRALNLRCYNRRATGSIFTNIYTVNEPGGGASTVERVVEAELWDELIINQLNVEGVNTVASPVLLNDVRNANITSLHYERVKLGGWASGFIDVYGPESRAAIDAMTICLSELVPAASGGGDRLGIVKVGDGVNVRVRGFSQHANTATANERSLVVSDGATSSNVQFDISNHDSILNGREFIGGAAPQFPIVKKVNDAQFHWQQAGMNHLTGTEAPTTGIWSIGDTVWNESPSAGGAPGWTCVSAGSPGTWKAMASLTN